MFCNSCGRFCETAEVVLVPRNGQMEEWLKCWCGAHPAWHVLFGIQIQQGKHRHESFEEQRKHPWVCPPPNQRRRLSCGCRPDIEVLRRIERHGVLARRGRRDYLAKQEKARRTEDRKGWTAEMELALCTRQPVCVVCGADIHLTKDHVHPLCRGGRLQPGNVVRLCRSCNSRKQYRGPAFLPDDVRGRIEAAARDFGQFWNNWCAREGLERPAVE